MLREYIIRLLIIATFVAFATAVAHPGLRQATGFATGILVICAIMLPLVDIIKDINLNFDVDEYLGSTKNEQPEDVIKVAFEDGIREYISVEYGVDESLVIVLADGFDMSKMRAERIYVTLMGKAALLDYKRIEEMIEREFTNNGECEVSVKIG